MTGRSTPATGGVTDDPIRIGTMLYTLVEPHRGHQVAYNRWYERDHFYAGCQIGAYNFAGARFVATAALKGLRYPTGPTPWSPIRRPAAISGVYYVLDGHHDEWNRWAVDQVNVLHAAGRMFNSGTTSIPASTTSSGSTGATRTACRPSSPSTTGSRAWCRSSSSRPRGDPRADRRLVPRPVPALGPARLAGGHGAGLQPPSPAGRRPRRRPPQRRRPTGGCCCSTSSTRTRRRAGTRCSPASRALADAGLGRVQWASPFIGTVPGTDTYTDQLWSAPV